MQLLLGFFDQICSFQFTLERFMGMFQIDIFTITRSVPFHMEIKDEDLASD